MKNSGMSFRRRGIRGGRVYLLDLYKMKYGLIITSCDVKKKEKFINVGDDIQSLAVYYIYQRMGIPDDKIEYIDFKELTTYKGEYLLLPICFNLQTDYKIMPFSDRIVPCFIGLSLFATSDVSDELCNYLQRYEPIGCRDEQTMKLLRQHNIECYLAGCITATLPRRDLKTVGEKVFLCDLSNEILEKIPSRILERENIEVLSHIYSGEKYMDSFAGLDTAKDLLKRYREEAKLVITSRLHSLSPCMAMGIPVIGLFSNISPRMGWIDKFLSLYTVEEIDTIDWNGTMVEYEEIKSKMISVAIRMIRNRYNQFNDMLEVSEFFENRKRALYGNYYYKKVTELPYFGKEFPYIIWGAGQIALEVTRVMKESCPKSHLVGVVDTYRKGQYFLGILIEDPICIREKYMNVFCIITTYSGEKHAKSYLREVGKTDFLSFASVNG